MGIDLESLPLCPRCDMAAIRYGVPCALCLTVTPAPKAPTFRADPKVVKAMKGLNPNGLAKRFMQVDKRKWQRYTGSSAYCEYGRGKILSKSNCCGKQAHWVASGYKKPNDSYPNCLCDDHYAGMYGASNTP